MNKRLKELAVQAELFWSERDGRWHLYDDSKDLERFAELVRQDEREVCAKLCEIWLFGREGSDLAATIRERGEK